MAKFSNQAALDDDDAEMAMAANDPLFMADLHEVMTDFQYADFDESLLADFEEEQGK
ncbi:MAG: hypothetical protein HOP19_00930 [Acidobacteria bacterium]|nr:hypothetical protein [Acidobacteriota bacterium]